LDLLIELLNGLIEGIKTPFYYFFDPSKRIHFVYLISSVLLAYYVFHKMKVNYSFIKYLFNKKVWFSKSAFIDYKFIFFNGIIKVILILPIVRSWRYLGININDHLEESFGIASFSLTQNQTFIGYALFIVIAYDFVFYLIHLAMHKVSFLWEFHKIHHSAKTLNPITQYRLHPVELIINNLSYAIVSGIALGIFDYLSKEQLSLSFYFNANIFSALFLFWGANLRHSHVKLGYFNFLEKFLLSPRQHQIHHSNNPIHFNRNLGAKLAIWDWTFGTLICSKNQNQLRFGLNEKEMKDYDSFLKTLYIPFLNFIKLLKK